MSYPFHHIEDHKVYKSTFLHRVEASFNFNVPDYDLFKAVLSGCMEDDMGIVLDPGSIESMPIIGLRLSAREGAVALRITNNWVKIKFRKGSYVSFQDSLSVILNFFKKIFIISRASITNLSLDKFNAFPYDRDISQDDLKENVFSNRYQNSEKFTIEDESKLNFHWIQEYSSETDLTHISILTGIDSLDEENKNLLSIHSKAWLDREIDVTKLTEEMSHLNDLLYDCFHWLISDNLLERMSKEEEREWIQQ